MRPTDITSNFRVAWAALKPADEQLQLTTNALDLHGADSSQIVLALSASGVHPSQIALTLSTRIHSRGQRKSLMNMMSGLDMFALALTICREVRIFPVAVVHSMFILRSRIKGSFPIARPNYGNVWLSKRLVRCFLRHCN
jgi:hypothetical protein